MLYVVWWLIHETNTNTIRVFPSECYFSEQGWVSYYKSVLSKGVVYCNVYLTLVWRNEFRLNKK